MAVAARGTCHACVYHTKLCTIHICQVILYKHTIKHMNTNANHSCAQSQDVIMHLQQKTISSNTPMYTIVADHLLALNLVARTPARHSLY